MKPEVISIKLKRRRVAIWLGLFLFSIYLLIYRGGFHSVDEVSMFAVTESLAKFGRFNTDQIAWTQWTTIQAEAQGFFGVDGHVYSKKGLAFSLAQAPLYWLALNLPGLGMLQTVSLLNALLTAATGLLIFMLLHRMNFSMLTAALATLIFGIATLAIVYAKYLFSEPLAGFLLLLATYMLFAYRQEGGFRHIAIAGLAAGFAVLTRANNLFLLPVFGLYLLWVEKESIKSLTIDKRFDNRQLFGYSMVKASVTFILALLIPGIILLAYNAIRSGNSLQTGYDLTLFSPNILTGFYKLLFSPLRGLFIYSPILLLSLPGWWLLRRTYTAEAWLFLGLVGITIGLFSAWSSGEGLSWGSRFLVPVVPFFVVSLAPVIEQVTASKGADNKVASDKVAEDKVTSNGQNLPPIMFYVLRFTFYALLPLSLFIQFLGVVINPWVFLAKMQSEFGGEFFLENTVALYDFRYTQIVGQLQSWSLENSDLVWWQSWGFDGLAFGLSLTLTILSGWLLWRQLATSQSSTNNLTRNTQYAIYMPITILLFTVVTYFLLTRYYHTDQQFGQPDDSYTQVLNSISTQTTMNEPIITVAQYHYHVPMNRFKERVPLIGFAQQVESTPESALPLLSMPASSQIISLVTLGFPPAAPDNVAERWLAVNTFKISDEWFPDEVRLVQFSAIQPTITQLLETNFGDEAELVKVSLLDSRQSGQVVPVEFVWRPLTQPKTDYNIFLQLLNAEGQLVAQHDNPPNGGYTPSSTWQKDQIIISRHALKLPTQLSTGNYQLIAGLYNPATGQRLSIGSDADDFISLGNITVTENIANLEMSER